MDIQLAQHCIIKHLPVPNVLHCYLCYQLGDQISISLILFIGLFVLGLMYVVIVFLPLINLKLYALVILLEAISMMTSKSVTYQSLILLGSFNFFPNNVRNLEHFNSIYHPPQLICDFLNAFYFHIRVYFIPQKYSYCFGESVVN